ncbi:MAG: EAL domain-containing protein [Cyanobacteria bacterium J06635_1]
MAKILVIEDEPQMRASLAELLELYHFSVVSASDGQVGIDLAQTSKPDLILCDINMPELSGYQVLSQLRDGKDTSLIPLIFLTAKADYAALRQGMELGAEDYLAKPFEPKDLIRAIEAQLKKREQLSQGFARSQSKFIARSQSAEESGFVDTLTGLTNLVGTETRFNEIVKSHAATSASLCLVLLKVQGYNDLQDRFGHVFGAAVLRAVAQCLQNWAQSAGIAVDTLAYIGSERFAILLMTKPDDAAFATITASLNRHLSAPLTIKNHTLQIEYSLSRVIEAGQDFNQCLIKAIQQINATRQLAKSTIIKPFLSMEARLKRALSREEFELYYQPQVDLGTGEVIGAEALIRWNSHDEGLISPAQFIPIAEESGLILPIGEWVLRAACQQIKQWQETAFSVMTIAINLSAKQFQVPDLQSRLVSILHEEDIEPSLIDLELTESLLVDDVDRTSKMLKDLRESGFAIAIDDFGTGYSSLGYLQRFPINVLKIDKCFIRHLDTNLSNLVIVKAIIEMAQGLRIDTIAEGVETPAELATLRQLNCGAMQGYVFSQPLCAKAFEGMIAKAHEKQGMFLANC